MKYLRTRGISLLLAMAMLVTMLPTAALAADTAETAPESAVSETIATPESAVSEAVTAPEEETASPEEDSGEAERQEVQVTFSAVSLREDADHPTLFAQKIKVNVYDGSTLARVADRACYAATGIRPGIDATEDKITNIGGEYYGGIDGYSWAAYINGRKKLTNAKVTAGDVIVLVFAKDETLQPDEIPEVVDHTPLEEAHAVDVDVVHALEKDKAWLETWLAQKKYLGKNKSEDQITENLNLDSRAPNGSILGWELDSYYISGDGTVTRYELTQDTDVKLTKVTLSYLKEDEENYDEVTISPNLTFHLIAPGEDERAVLQAQDYLSFWDIRGENQGQYALDRDLNLGSEYYGCAFQWKSSKPEVITDAGKVTRPELGQERVPVTLTATISKGEFTATKTMDVAVQPLTEYWYATREAAEALTLGDTSAVRTALDLPQTAQSATYPAFRIVVTWASSDESRVTSDGAISRPGEGEGPVTVTLTATVTADDNRDTASKQFTVTLLPMTAEETKAKAEAKTAAETKLAAIMDADKIQYENLNEVTEQLKQANAALDAAVKAGWLRSETMSFAGYSRIGDADAAMEQLPRDITFSVLGCTYDQKTGEVTYTEDDFVPPVKLKIPANANLIQILLMVDKMYPELGMDRNDDNYKFHGLGRTTSVDGKMLRWMYFIDGAETGEQWSSVSLKHGSVIKWAYTTFPDPKNTGFPASKAGYDTPLPADQAVDYDLVDPTVRAAEALTVDQLLNGNVSADSLTSDLYLPKTGFRNATIRWKSSNTDVMTNDGKIVNYILMSGKKKVTMTATVSYDMDTNLDGLSYPEIVKSFDFVIRPSEATVEEKAVTLAAEALTLGDTSLLTGNLELPQSGVLSTKITWKSSDPSVITDAGVISRPRAGQKNAEAELTATIEKDGASQKKTFQITVKAQEKSGSAAVAEDLAALTFDAIRGENTEASSIRTSLCLPAIGYQGSAITWDCAPAGRIAADGAISRPQPDEAAADVTLTATVTKDGVTQTRAFALTLIPMTQEEALIDAAARAFAAVPDADDITEATRDKLQAKAKIKAAKTAYQAAVDAGVLPSRLSGYGRVLEADEKMHRLPAYITLSIMGDIDDDPKTETFGYMHQKEKIRVPAGWSLMMVTKAVVEHDKADITLTYGGAFLQSMYGKGPWMYEPDTDVVGAWGSGAAGYTVEHDDNVWWYQVYTKGSTLEKLKETGYDVRIPADEPYTLDLVTETVDKTALQEMITRASALREEDYRNYASWSESWKNVQDALTYAKKIAEDPAAIQYDVDKAYNRLNDAIQALEPYEADKTALQASIKQAQSLTEADYKQGWADMTDALQIALSVDRSPYAIQREVDETQAALSAAIIALVPKGNTTDKTALREKAEEAAELVRQDYTEISWRNLESAYAYANTILAKGNAAQSEVDEALSGLRRAMEQLLPAAPVSVADRVAVSVEALGEQFIGSTDPWEVMDMAYADRAENVDKAAFMKEALRIAEDKNSSATDLERTAIALTALGVHAGKIDAGDGTTMDLIGKIVNHESELQVNALTFALIALDSGSYQVPEGAVWTREKLIDRLLKAQHDDGGWVWNLDGVESDVDMTAMVITALAPYYNKGNENVVAAVDRAMTYLKGTQRGNGAFGAGSEAHPDNGNANSTAMVILAASSIGKDAASEFAKKAGPFPWSPSVTVFDGLFNTFETTDHLFGFTDNAQTNRMAMEQVYRALLTYQKYLKDPGVPQTPYVFAEPVQGNVVDKDVLREKIRSLEGIQQGNYTDESWNAFQKELAAAKALVNSGSATQEQVDRAVFTLMSAYRKLSTGSGSEFVDHEAPVITTTAKNETVKDSTYIFRAVGKDAIEGDMPVQVTLNGVAVSGVNGYYTVELTSGTNTIVITSEDYSGNRAEKTVTVVYSTGGSGGKDTITVTFKLTGEDNKTWIEETAYTVQKNSTVWDVFSQALTENNLQWEERLTNYISGIQIPGSESYLREFDKGAKSGWMYTVNKKHPNVGLRDYYLANGDAIVWHYTEDYTKEEGSDKWSSGGSSAPATAMDKVSSLISAIGTVTKDSGDKIKAARDAYDKLTEAQKKLVSNYDVLTRAEAEYAKLMAAPVEGLPFTDVNGHWAYDAIKYAYENSLFAGTSATTFGPNVSMNRAMLVTVLYRLDKEPSAETTSSFKDVPADQWYTKAVAWASANKIVSGYSADTFGPTDTITREQMASILYRYAQYKGYDVSKTTDLAAFTDKASVSDWALTSMQWANAEKLINGRTATTLVPQGNATRAEVAQILMTFAETVIK